MLILAAIFIVVLAFAIAGLKGAPYVPILRRESEAFFELAKLTPGQTLVDLGAGDGRLLRAAAKQGIRGIGYEINPFMVLVAKIVCWPYRSLVSIHLADLWSIKLPPADTVYVFLMPQFMKRLDQKLSAEITTPTEVISYAFEIPDRMPVRRNANTYVYRYGRPT